jgi:hypothetical protein
VKLATTQQGNSTMRNRTLQTIMAVASALLILHGVYVAFTR